MTGCGGASASGHVDAWEEFWTWWKITWPTVITNLSTFAMSISDMAVLGQFSNAALAGAALGALVTSGTSSLLNAFPSAVSTLAAQAIGRGNGRLAGLWAQSGFFWAMVFALPLVVGWLYSGQILWSAGFCDGSEASLADTFTSVLTLSIPARVAFSIAMAYFRSIQVVKPAMVAGLAMVGMNLGLSTLLVHGAGGVQGLGFVGAPIATTISVYLALGLLLGWTTWFKRHHDAYWPRSGWSALVHEGLSRQRTNEFLLGQALPLVTSRLVEVAQRQTLTALAAGLGPGPFVASQLILDVFSIASSFMYGLVGAGITRVGHHLGAGHLAGAKRAMWLQLGACATLGAVVATTLISARLTIGQVLPRDPEVLEALDSIAWIVGCGYFFRSLTSWCTGVLVGQGRPGWVAAAFIIGVWVVGIPISFFAVHAFDGGLRGLWFGATAGYTVSMLVAIVGLWLSDWPLLAAEAQSKADSRADWLEAEVGYELAPLNDGEGVTRVGGRTPTFHCGGDEAEEPKGRLVVASPGALDQSWRTDVHEPMLEPSHFWSEP